LITIASLPPGQAQTSPPQVLDRVVAVVNNRPILWSEINDELRFSVLDPETVSGKRLTPQHVLQQLISRTLIQQQIRQEDVSTSQPDGDEVKSRVVEVRKELPACVRMNCASDSGWQAFLQANQLTAPQVEAYLRLRLEVLRFIEIRFRQGIRISPEEIAAYYRDKLVPQYAKEAPVPPLNTLAPRIEEILLEQQVNVLFGNWLDNLRKQENVEILDPTLKPDAKASNASEEVE
jgi:hypothetical protein